jgi:Cu+-exporting ATPase
VQKASVAVESRGRAEVRWRPNANRDLQPVLQAVKESGYDARPAGGTAKLGGHSEWSLLDDWKLNVVVGSIATGLLILGEWVFQLGMVRWFQWLAFALALPVQIFCGARFYLGAWNQLKIGSSNMDTLVALGSTTAFVYSAWGLFARWHTHLYFMEAAAIITLISVGHWLESKATARAAGALRFFWPAIRAKAPRGWYQRSPSGRASARRRGCVETG